MELARPAGRGKHYSREPDALQPAGKLGPEFWKANAS